MTGGTSNNISIFSSTTRASFLDHVRKNPNNRRVSSTDLDVIVEWLTNPSKRALTQKEHSRRNYVRKTFVWSQNTRSLLANSKAGEENHRAVIIEDDILDVVESVHQLNNHLGWDATWRDISNSYYGILRSDVIFLLKQCEICAQVPSKRPKGFTASEPNRQAINRQAPQALNTCDTRYTDDVWELEDEEQALCYQSLDGFTQHD
ncbi:hypothetical protein MMC17_000822 [Xylographa soralifera]|nr:hypothetical protein [Xylographa soralifera]